MGGGGGDIETFSATSDRGALHTFKSSKISSFISLWVFKSKNDHYQNKIIVLAPYRVKTCKTFDRISNFVLVQIGSFQGLKNSI